MGVMQGFRAKDDSIARSLMLICLGAAILLVTARPQGVASSASSPMTSPEQPEGTAVRSAKATELTPVTHSRLVVDLSDRQVYLYQRDRLQTQYPIAVGQAGWETPTGKFIVTDMQENPAWRHPITGEVIPGPNSPLGSRWIGFWSNGKNQIGFHGTDQEELIGQAVSHGCLRLRNQDVIALYRKVQPGTPVIVKP